MTTFAGGQVCYEPIMFQESLKIESVNYSSGGWAREHHYYQYNYLKLPAATQVTAYTGALSAEQQTAHDAAVARYEYRVAAVHLVVGGAAHDLPRTLRLRPHPLVDGLKARRQGLHLPDNPLQLCADPADLF